MHETLFLIVDQDVLEAKKIQQSLEELGHSALIAGTESHEAIKIAEQWVPNIILMQGQFAKKQAGTKMVDTIINHLQIPIIFYTSDEISVTELEFNRPILHIPKPIDIHKLNKAIELSFFIASLEGSVRRMKQDIKLQKEFLIKIINNIPMGIYVKNREQNIITIWNKELERLTGLFEISVVGKTDTSIFNTYFREWDNILEKPLSNRFDNIGSIYELENRNGTFMVAVNYIPYGDGVNEFTIGVVQDITDLFFYEHKLREYQGELEGKNETLIQLHEQIESEFERQFQAHEIMISHKIPQIKGIEFGACCMAANQICHDFYKIFQIDNKIVVLIADIPCLDPDSMLINIFIKEALKDYLLEYRKRESTLQLTADFIRDYINTKYEKSHYKRANPLSIFIASYDIEQKVMEFSGTNFESLPVIAAPNISICECDIVGKSLVLQTGTTILFSTDGLLKQIASNQQYKEQLMAIVEKWSDVAPELLVRIIEDDLAKTIETPVNDDVVFLVFQLADEKVVPKLRIELGSSFDAIHHTKDQISHFIEHYIDGICVNLWCFQEMLVNAVEHGNRFDHKKKAIVEVELRKSSIVFTITDEGEGFNWRELLETDSCLLSFNERGRGIIMSKMLSSKLLYNETGNQVTIIYNIQE